MTAGIPAAARSAFVEGGFCYLAVSTQAGPHLTPVVYVWDRGSLWLTTARGTVKARAWRRDPTVAGLVRAAGASVTFRGTVRTYDALDPLSWPAAAVAGPRLVRAATRFSVKNARFFAGYAVDAAKVPLGWTPPGRVFVRVDPVAGRLLWPAGFGTGDEWGEWEGGPSSYAASFRSLPRARGLDLRAPAAVRSAVAGLESGVLALQGEDGLTVLPAPVRRVASEAAWDAALPGEHVDLAGIRPGAAGALTLDRASSWRATAMAGMLLQGPVGAYRPRASTRGREALRRRIARAAGEAEGEEALEDRVLVRIRPSRLVWWEGWRSGSARRRQNGARR